ncbi:transcriptional regulator, TrmB [Salinarchaeum sp. Harcht-Bsk1]|uniref:TrmB family transcriptional regulator n=1 Tax=Salinarchaeum sp. Harcht-Bsk1 TaxID=1333523 RepID=UPI00034230DE|nr:TrmB family transcriptional regulator [Salinarchaeum sp. Harcht-Bsk1]AGN01976.1 transcriptional regulator, TrmB [Salinarchaeum sp. Harcht-Bsk1]
MENEDSVRRGLQRIGLSQYQSEAYLAVIQHGPLAAVDVAEKSGIPSSRIYDVLTDLEHDGYVTTFEREDRRYVQATEPSDLVNVLRQTGEQLSETAEDIEEVWEQNSIDDHQVNLVKQVDSTLERARAFIENAETSVDVAATPSQYYQLREALATAHANDVVVRVSIEDVSPGQIDATQPVTELRRRGIPGPFVAIVDRTYTCFSPNDRAASDYGLVVNDRILSFIFRWYFQLCLWSVCDPIYVADSEGKMYVSLVEFVRDVYPLWLEGAMLPVTIEGTDPQSRDSRRVSGVVSGIRYPDMSLERGHVPTYSDLSSFLTLAVTDETGETHLVGGWGAVFEDLEADRIVVHGSKVVLPPSLPAELG